MGIRTMPWDEWIELDDQFQSYHRIREHRAQTRGDKVVRIVPGRPGLVCGGGHAALELVQELSEYLSARYPTTFQIERHAQADVDPKSYVQQGWDGKPPVKSVTIAPMGVTYQLNQNAEDMMKVAGLLVQDDLALMLEGEDGQYYFQAGAIMVSGFWRMEDKIGLPLDAIHTNGNVPQFKEKLQTSMERFFRRMTVDKPIIRNNYFIQVVKPGEEQRTDATPSEYSDLDPEELAWSTTTNGPEDTFNHGHPGTAPSSPTVLPSTIRLRTERQTLRRLPRSGAVLFTIRTYLFPVTELAKEKGVPARMASAIRSWPADVAKYKGQNLYRDVLIDYLDEQAHAQVAEGVVEEGERVKAEYPF
ncbi:hypothetical protein FIBSPDRAFT_141100 [Athelia psychrophila]|uniref:Uncharacterized protein n=1 Tax=Athelia psychrophila TaxID=1759441 RepID=A0A166BY99_9AGAM|nr:hypothetical protein FIBSPDRAFT_141100 [Fibularhizoctonia sp. CBS 109695]